MEILVNGYAYPSIDPDVLADWSDYISLLLCFSYGFTDQGALIPLDDYEMRAIAESKGVKSMMVLTPLDPQGAFNNELVDILLSDEEKKARLLNEILAELQRKNMFGVDFDFEFVFAENKDQYSQFVQDAALKLNPEGYLVTVALAPKVSADQPGLLYQGHDYAAMGEAANFVLLMTYEWGYTYGPPMAVAPLPAVRRVLTYGISEINPDKILMGMPNYGYDWTLPFVQGESRAEQISNPEAVARAARYGVEIQFDEDAQSPFYYYTDEQGREHVVWFEDYRSWSAKFALLKELGLAGFSIWHIMYPFPEGTRAIAENFEVIRVQ